MQPVDPLLAELIESLPTTPAVVVDGRFDVVAANVLARAVSPSFRVGANLAAAIFVNPSARRTLPHWEEVSARMIELLMEASEPEPDQADADPSDAALESVRLAVLRAELAERSAEFSTAWEDRVLPSSYALEVTMDHPDVGQLDITYELLRLHDTKQFVIMGHTRPGSESEQRLFLLAARSDPASC